MTLDRLKVESYITSLFLLSDSIISDNIENVNYLTSGLSHVISVLELALQSSSFYIIRFEATAFIEGDDIPSPTKNTIILAINEEESTSTGLHIMVNNKTRKNSICAAFIDKTLSGSSFTPVSILPSKRLIAVLRAMTSATIPKNNNKLSKQNIDIIKSFMEPEHIDELYSQEDLVSISRGIDSTIIERIS